MRFSSRKAGFTLVEVIAVLVVLGILAAVAVPRYMDLDQEASMRAALAAKNEAQSRLYLHFSSFLLHPDARTAAGIENRCEAAWAASLQEYIADSILSTGLGNWEVRFGAENDRGCMRVDSILYGAPGKRTAVDLSGADLDSQPWLVCPPTCK